MADKRKLIEELRSGIERVYGCRAEHRRTALVNERIGGNARWQGEVEVFWLADHPQARRCYAWLRKESSVGPPFEMVLELPPVIGPATAVRSVISSAEKRRSS